MYTVKEVGRAGVRRASLGQPVGGQLHRFCFVPEVPTCWGQQATGIACPRAGRGPNQPGPALQSGVLACTAASLRAEGCPAAAEAPLELGLRVLCPLFRSTPGTTPPAPDIYRHLDATPVYSPAGLWPPERASQGLQFKTGLPAAGFLRDHILRVTRFLCSDATT